MSKEKFGSYLRGTVSSWSNGQTTFSESSGTGVSWDNQFTYIPSYEFGFLYNVRKVTWRLGFEFVQPAQLNTVNGKDSVSSTNYYTLSSALSAANPKLGLEFNVKSWVQSRLWILAEAGVSFLDVQNNYTFTPAGTTKYNIANFREEVKSTQPLYDAGIGFETLMSDSTTFSIELGYRFLDFTNLSQNLTVTNFQGAVTPGTAATTNSGGARDLNLSGFYAAIDFRIWLF